MTYHSIWCDTLG